MRVTCYGYGTLGDIQPYVALGVALAERGHDVVLATPAAFAPAVTRAGLGHAVLAGDPADLLARDRARQLLAEGDVVGLLAELRAGLRPHRAALEDDGRAAAEGADVIVGTSVTSFLADACADATGATLTLCELSPLTPQSVAVTSVIDLAEAEALRHRWGLPARLGNPDALARARGVPVIHAFSEHLVPRHPSWGATHHVTGAFVLSEAEGTAEPGAHHDPEFAAWLDEGPPPVYLGFGSLPLLLPDVMAALASDAARDVGTRVVVGLPWTPVAEGPDGSRTVWRVRACRHDWLFPRCRAVVHHGGAGTVHTAARAGTPQVVCSVFSDQPFWGAMVALRKVGVHLPFRELTRERLRGALAAACGVEVAANAAALRDRMRAETGTAHAVSVIEQLGRQSR